MKTKIGIDLGTSTCEISYLENGEAKIIKNLQEGESSIIPSAILFDNANNFKVGNIAKKKVILNPNLVVENIKGLMGTKTLIELGDESYTPEFISAILAKRLKEIAEFSMNEKIEDVIVTVPAKFDSLQRKATRDALIIAGFNNVDIINEPTAAAIAYGVVNLTKKEKVLVYDLGGGTFDVSILEIENNNYKVLASEGDMNHGGNAINKILFDTIVNLFESSVGTKLDATNKRLITELNIAIEEAKQGLSFETVASIVVPNIAFDSQGSNMDLNLDLSRDDFEYLIDDFIDNTLGIVDKTLQSVSISNNDIDKVILVGGSTRMPLIRKKVNEKFSGKVLNGVNPDELVAKGAILSTLNDNKDELSSISEIINNDIGVEILNGQFDKIVAKGTTLPVRIKKSYKTVEDNQEIAEIKIYEGQESDIKANKFISSFDIDNIPKDNKGIQHIDLIFTCNLDGVLLAESKIISNLKEVKRNISLKGLEDKDIELFKNKISKINVFNGINGDEYTKEELEEECKKARIIEEKRVEAQRKEAERIKAEQLAAVEREQERVRLEQEQRLKENAERERIEKGRLEEERRTILAKEQEEKKIKGPTLKLNISNNSGNQVKNIVDKSTEKNNIESAGSPQTNMQVQSIASVAEVVDASELIEEYDPSRDGEIYNDIATLMEYYKRVSPDLDNETKEKAQELVGDLVGLVKKDKFREARTKENEIIQLIYIG